MKCGAKVAFLTYWYNFAAREMSGIDSTLILYGLITIIHNYYKSIQYYFPGKSANVVMTFMILLVKCGTYFVH